MPNDSLNVNLNELTEKEYLVLAAEAVVDLGWRIKLISNGGIIAYTENGAYSWNGEVIVKIEKGIANIQCRSLGMVYGQFGREAETVDRFLKQFEKIRLTFSSENIEDTYKEIKKDFVPDYEDTLDVKPAPKRTIFDSYWSYFKPSNQYFAGPVLVNLNILIFIVTTCAGFNIFSPSSQDMMNWGANVRSLTFDQGQWWRLISSCFLHFGIVHLLMNMIALIFICVVMEPYMGRVRVFTAYLLTGIAGSLASSWWHNFTVSAGASGAILGLYGVTFALVTTSAVDSSVRKGMKWPILMLIIYNLVYGFLKGGTDNAAHIGGLSAGILLGYAFVPALKAPRRIAFNWISLTVTIFLVLAGTAMTYSALNKSTAFAYDKGIRTFIVREKLAMDIFKQAENQPRKVVLANIENSGINYWRQNINLINQLDRFELSDKQHQTNAALIKYCNLRIAGFRLKYHAIAQSTDAYNIQLEENLNQINKLMDTISIRN